MKKIASFFSSTRRGIRLVRELPALRAREAEALARLDEAVGELVGRAGEKGVAGDLPQWAADTETREAVEKARADVDKWQGKLSEAQAELRARKPEHADKIAALNARYEETAAAAKTQRSEIASVRKALVGANDAAAATLAKAGEALAGDGKATAKDHAAAVKTNQQTLAQATAAYASAEQPWLDTEEACDKLLEEIDDARADWDRTYRELCATLRTAGSARQEAGRGLELAEADARDARRTLGAAIVAALNEGDCPGDLTGARDRAADMQAEAKDVGDRLAAARSDFAACRWPALASSLVLALAVIGLIALAIKFWPDPPPPPPAEPPKGASQGATATQEELKEVKLREETGLGLD